jgi:Ni/Fe-hydrogenase subunit HybB-like protein
MKLISRLFTVLHASMAALFAFAALALIVIAAQSGWHAITSGMGRDAALEVIEALGLLAAAVVALQIAQTITEEEVMRDAHISGPTRVRRFLSRFLVVVVVAISIEALVATFKASHEDPLHMVYAASILVAAALMLAAWGFFIRMNCFAEELEPEAMADAKSEDKKPE